MEELLIVVLAVLLLVSWGVCWRNCHAAETQPVPIQKTHPEELQRFLQRLDHELKNPVTAIHFALANLSATVQDTSQDAAIETIRTQTLRINRLITDLRKLAEFDRIAIEHIPVVVGTLIQEAITQANDPSRDFVISIDTDKSVMGDKYLLMLAIYNLIDNALKFTDPATPITINVTDDGDNVHVTITDTGVGIPAQDLQHIWDELYRGQTTRHIPGSGLGLAMVKAIVERHGGEVSLHSRAGHGTTVTLTIPVNQC